MRKAREGGCLGTRPLFLRTIRTSLAACLLIGIMGSAACSSKPALANAYASPEALAAAVLEAMQAGDRARLEAIALNEQEFKDHVWPDLPAARPERNLPFSYVWGDLRQKSQMALSVTLQQHTGQRYELRAVRFSGTRQYAGYRVHSESVFRVRDSAGREDDIRVCGSMLEKDGAWKVFSYVVD